jgi:glycosyltransferase involved in cell wall biosynthesis
MLTVLMATYNGSGTIEACLDAYCRLDPPSGGWKLVIVDNASTDSTASIIRSFASRLPVHFCQEPVQGKNAALNTGLREVSGDLVVFTDDDAVPHNDWLTAMRSAADAHPAFALFGGKVLPRWQSPPDSWILEWVPLGIAYGVTPPTLREGEIGAGSLFGPNMAIRASIFASGCRFDPSIGPRGNGSYTMGSETELNLRLESSGLKAWHVESAVVEHIVQNFQIEPKWILRRAALFGREIYRLHDEKRFVNSIKLSGVPIYLIRRALLEAAKSAHARLRGDTRKRFGFRWKLNFTLGEIIESRELRHSVRIAGEARDPTNP